MSAPRLVDVPQPREEAVDRVEQPEARDVGDAKLREALIFLTPARGKAAALRRQDLDQPTRDRHDILVRTDVDERRHEARIELILARRRFPDACDTQRTRPLE